MRPVTIEDYRERMLRVLLHIQENLNREMPLDELAAVANFSPFHFHRIFRGMVGESVQAHIRRIRLERAATRLKHGEESVLMIALDAGYESHEAFTRAFRAVIGQSPSAFRTQCRAQPKGSSPAGVHFGLARLLDDFVPHADGGETMEATIKNMEPMRVAFVRHIGPYDQCGKAWETLCMRVGARGGLGPGSRFIGLSHDDPDVTPPERIRYDACVTVPADFQPEGEVGVQVIEGGDYAVTVHHGPYERLSETYARLCGQWVPRNGRSIRAAPSVEIYLNAPERTRPEDLATEVYVPLEPVREG